MCAAVRTETVQEYRTQQRLERDRTRRDAPDPPELGEARRWLTAAATADDDAVEALGHLPSEQGK